VLPADAAATMKRLLDPASLRALARGCAVLGAGGGGDPHIGLLQALQATEDFGPVPLVDMDELPGEALMTRTAVSVRLIAGAPVALVDHARAERPGLDQV